MNEKSSLVFYNLLFVAQNKNLNIHQDKFFGSLTI